MTATFGTIYVIFKKCVALISAIMMLVVGADEKDTPAPVGAEVISKTTYVLYDQHMTSQGVTNDGEYFYLAAKRIWVRLILKRARFFSLPQMQSPMSLKIWAMTTSAV